MPLHAPWPFKRRPPRAGTLSWWLVPAQDGDRLLVVVADGAGCCAYLELRWIDGGSLIVCSWVAQAPCPHEPEAHRVGTAWVHAHAAGLDDLITAVRMRADKGTPARATSE